MKHILAALLLFSIPAAAESVVVLPFVNLTQNLNLNWIGESVADSIQEALYGEGMLVLDRDARQEAYRRLSVKPYVQISKATMVRIGDELDARWLVFGTFELEEKPAGQRPGVKLTARMIDMRGRKQSTEFFETGSLDDLAVLEIHLGWQALKFLSPTTKVTQSEFVARHPRARVDAKENYIRGLLATNLEQKHHLLTQAARLDADYSQPCFQLGMMQYEKENYRVAADWFARVKSNDPRHRRAQFMLGLSRYWSADFQGALRAFSFVMTQVPVNEVICNLGLAQMRTNSPDAIENLKKAVEADDADVDYQFNLGYALWRRGDFLAASERFRAVLDRFPDDQEAKQLLAKSDKKQGQRPGDASTEGLERLKEEYEESVYWQLKAMVEKK